MSFVHLHVHTYYSVLDGAAQISKLFEKAKSNGQPALAITDHGNMFGVKEFLKTASKFPEVKPIVGCEVYVAKESRTLKRGREDQSSYHLILLAKNIQGYHNLVKLCSYGYIDGFYYKPRIDHELLEQYHEGLICASACLAGEVARAITKDDIEEAERTAQWYKDLFGEDYYLEVQRHKTDCEGGDKSVYPAQEKVAQAVFGIAEKYGIKCIATNDVHFVTAEDAPAHDRLICLTTNSSYDDPDRLRYTWQEYLKTTEEMSEIFADHPEVIANTLEVAEKIERYSIDSKPILPIFPLPDGFSDSNDYLHYLTYEGAKKRYGENLDGPTTERIDFELATIRKMGFPDYFLIVQDFVTAAKGLGVSVGPGRGSAAGSVVAYCLGITQIDPIKYDLLFERFLNPDRISMPDIDIDFDDDGRSKVLEYVEGKYGKDHVSHVITFGTMAAKSAIKDIARIQNLPLSESDRLAKAIPDKFNFKEDGKDKPPKVNIQNCIKYVDEIKAAYESDNPVLHNTIEYARRLEGTVRNTGVHACAIIIGRSDLTDFIPISIAKDKETGADMWVSQYEGSYIEEVGMLKMDFLGLKTLSIIKDAVRNVKLSKGIDLDIANIPIDDKATYDLYSRGDTVGTFQFESDGMRKWLRELKPTRFEDLIAMNALYRPGPLDYIPDFVDRKNGKKPIEYDLPEMEEFLADTYGITVYQEQVMLLSQKLAGFTKGQADGLRKAMGKKIAEKMAELKGLFMEGGQQRGHSREILEKIWHDWEAFAQYAFNKSHATCYAWVGYQTAYLKANYPAEYMAATLSKNLNDIEEITKLMDECRKQGIAVLGPDVNESSNSFTVNKDGNIRFGMAGIKGVGSGAVDAIIAEREKEPFRNIFDFVSRVNLGAVNKRTIESLAYSGAFDSFEDIPNRAVFCMPDAKGETFLESLVKYGSKVQNDSLNAANSLFGDSEAVKPLQPQVPIVADYNRMEFLKREKDLVGMYLSSHPLDIYKFEMDNFAGCSIADAMQLCENANSGEAGHVGADMIIAGLVTGVKEATTKSGRQYCTFSVEDFSGSRSFSLFGKDFEQYMKYAREGNPLLIKCRIQPRYWKKESDDKKNGAGGSQDEKVEYELKIKGMTLLSNAKDEFVKEVRVVLPVSKIDKDFRSSLKRAVKESKGKSMLTLDIVDRANNMSVEFFSKKFGISPSCEFIDYLNRNGLDYSIRKEVAF